MHTHTSMHTYTNMHIDAPHKINFKKPGGVPGLTNNFMMEKVGILKIILVN